MIVPTLRVGMHTVTLCVTITSRIDGRTQSVQGGIPTRSVGTICHGQKRNATPVVTLNASPT
jgi:hypothetical protein